MSAPKDIRRELLVASYALDRARDHTETVPTPEPLRVRIIDLGRQVEQLHADVAIWLES